MDTSSVRLGLRENLGQFLLLMLVNASAALRRAQAQGGNRWCLEN